jgi:YegS/Rv2252/BmrU family lipid kinase
VRLALVVNPTAGGGRGLRALDVLQRTLADHDMTATTTTSLDHADTLALEAVAADRVVVAVGGDGLVGRVAGTVAGAGGLMAALPGGRGNDFCRSVGIPLDPAAAARALPSYVERAVDLGMVDDRAFIGIASIGFDSEVQEKVLRSRLPLGNLIYAYGSLAVVARWKAARFDVTVDGVTRTVRGWNVAVANSGWYGGGMRLAPGATVTDGTLDLVTTADASKGTFLRTFPKLFRGSHTSHPAFTFQQVTQLRLDAEQPFRVFADGDPIGTLPCEIRVAPKALRMLLPAGYP